MEFRADKRKKNRFEVQVNWIDLNKYNNKL